MLGAPGHPAAPSTHLPAAGSGEADAPAHEGLDAVCDSHRPRLSAHGVTWSRPPRLDDAKDGPGHDLWAHPLADGPHGHLVGAGPPVGVVLDHALGPHRLVP